MHGLGNLDYYRFSTNRKCIAAYAKTMKTAAKTPSPVMSPQKANESNPKVLRMVAPGTSMSNPNLSGKSLVTMPYCEE